MALSLLGVLVLGLAISGTANAQLSIGSFNRISSGPGGISPAGNAGAPIASPSGRYIAFHSTDPLLVQHDLNGVRDVFVRDLNTNTTQRLSVSSAGIEGNAESRNPSISSVAPDGLFAVAFESTATNLDSNFGNTFGFSHIYLSLPTRAQTYLLSLAGQGLAVANGDSFNPSIAAIPAINRLRVAFSSDATNLVEDDSNNERDVFLATVDYRDLTSSNPASDLTIERISIPFKPGPNNLEADGDSDTPELSGDGRFVVFTSRATNLTAEGTAGFIQVFLYNINQRTTTLISKDAAGLPGNADSSLPTISYSGRFISYLTAATNISDAVTSGRTHVLRYDTTTGTTELVNATVLDEVGEGNAVDAQISPNGRFVAFSDNSSNLVPGDLNDQGDVFVKDFDSGEVVRASVSTTGGDPNDASSRGTIVASGFNSLDGTVSFLSDANNIIVGDITSSDVYAASVRIPLPFFRENTVIEVPPDVEVKRKRTVLSFQPFGTVLTAQGTGAAEEEQPQAAEGDERIRYQYRIRGPGVRIDNKNKLAKRSSVGVRGLKPGSYTTRYRALTVSDGRIVKRTPFSPPQRFQRPPRSQS